MCTNTQYVEKKEIEHSRAMTSNHFGGHKFTPKQEPAIYINPRGRYNYSKHIKRSRRAGATSPTRIAKRKRTTKKYQHK